MSGIPRYELFAWEYATSNPFSTDVVDWIRTQADAVGGPILELACGTGRLVAALARAGLTVHGIDQSEAMLAIARSNARRIEPEIQGEIHLAKMDMRDLRLDGRFGLIFIVDNSFVELRSEAHRKSCLRSVVKHLRPGGRFALSVSQLDLSWFHDGRSVARGREPLVDPKTGDVYSRTVKMSLSPDRCRLRSEFVFEPVDRSSGATTQRFVSERPLWTKDDYVTLLEEFFLTPSIEFDFGRTRDEATARHIDFVCTPRQMD